METKKTLKKVTTKNDSSIVVENYDTMGNLIQKSKQYKKMRVLILLKIGSMMKKIEKLIILGKNYLILARNGMIMMKMIDL